MKAQALATAASISLAVAQAHLDRSQERTRPQTRTIIIGEKGKRANQHLIALFIATAQANEVKVLGTWANGRKIDLDAFLSQVEAIDPSEHKHVAAAAAANRCC